MNVFPLITSNGSIFIPFFTFALLLALTVALAVGIFLLYRRLKNKYDQEFILRFEMERFYEMLSMAPDGYFSWFYDYGKNTVKDVCSRRLAVLLGLYKGVNSTFADVLERVCEDDRKAFKDAVNRLRSKGEAFALEFRLPDKERRIIAIGMRSENIGGIVLCDTVWMRDITANADSMDSLFGENKDLKNRYALIQAILDKLPFPLWTRDDTLALNYCNPSFIKAVGAQTKEEAISQNMELAQGDALHKVRALAAAARSAAKPMSELEHIVMEGKRRFAEITETPLNAAYNEYKRATVGVAYPLDREEELEVKLKGYVNAHDGVLENLTSAIAIFDAGNRLSFYNSSFLSVWGLDADWLDTHPSYSSFLDALREKKALPEVRDFPAFKREELESIKTLVLPQEDLIYLPQGKTLRRFMLPHPLGGVLLTYEDVTDKITMERSFNTLIEVQRATIDNIHEAVVLLDVDGRLKLYNSPYMELWGFETDFLEAKPSLEELVEKHKYLFTKDDKKWPMLKNEIMQLFSETATHARISRLDGRILDASSVRLADGGVLITFADITNAARTEKIMRERSFVTTRMNALRAKFISDLAEEFKKPLAALCDEEKIPSFKDALKIKDSFDDLMQLALAESATRMLVLDAIEAKSVVDDVAKDMASRIKRKDIDLIITTASDIGWIIADKERLKQILLYVFACSLNMAGISSRLEVTLAKVRKTDDKEARVQDWLMISFNPKFMPENKENLNKDFFGVGEALVKSLVAGHGGYMDFAEKDGYSVLSLYFPADRAN